MGFSKTFPRTLPGSTYPIWEEIRLTEEEEREVEEACRRENYQIMDECIREARNLVIKSAVNTEENHYSRREHHMLCFGRRGRQRRSLMQSLTTGLLDSFFKFVKFFFCVEENEMFLFVCKEVSA